MAQELAGRGGSDWLDALLYDEVHYSGPESDELCDLIHAEFVRLRFQDLEKATDRPTA